MRLDATIKGILTKQKVQEKNEGEKKQAPQNRKPEWDIKIGKDA